MSSTVNMKSVRNDEELEALMKEMGGDKASVVFFYLPYCGACQRIGPFVETLVQKHPSVQFIRVDAQKCMEASRKHRVTKVPLFLLYKDKSRVDKVEGASPLELESKLRRVLAQVDSAKEKQKKEKASSDPNSEGQRPGQGQSHQFLQHRQHRQRVTYAAPPDISPQTPGDLSIYLDKANCRVVNDLLPTSFQGFIEGNTLVSGKGSGRLLISYSFTERLMIQSFRIKAPAHSGPRNLKFYHSLGKNLDINAISQITPNQEVMLTEAYLSGDREISLAKGGFVGVNSLQILIPESMTKTKRIEVESLVLIGFPYSPSQ